VGGIHVASPAFLKTIREVCDHTGAIYIADSVQCGYGRSGHFFAHDYTGLSADLYTTAKGMGNGFPIGGVLISPRFKATYGMLGTTFGGNPLACAAALAVLEIIEKDHLISAAKEKGQYLMSALSQIPGLQNLRGMGLMIGFDLPDSNQTLRAKLLSEFRIFTGEAKPNTVRLLPSLTITQSEMDELIHALRKLVS
jgi:acetylornithine aminotransferase